MRTSSTQKSVALGAMSAALVIEAISRLAAWQDPDGWGNEVNIGRGILTLVSVLVFLGGLAGYIVSRGRQPPD